MVGFTWNGAPYFYIRNTQGDVVGIYDVDGAIKAWYTYDAWGKILDIWQADGYTVGELNPIRYRGYYYDTETDYYYCQSRYYNPEWCRWISADALMDTKIGILGTNMYAYCNNDPINLVDPSGMNPMSKQLAEAFDLVLRLTPIILVQKLIFGRSNSAITEDLMNNIDMFEGDRQGLFDFWSKASEVATDMLSTEDFSINYWWGTEHYLSHETVNKIKSVGKFTKWGATIGGGIAGLFSGAGLVIAGFVLSGEQDIFLDALDEHDQGRGAVVGIRNALGLAGPLPFLIPGLGIYVGGR